MSKNKTEKCRIVTIVSPAKKEQMTGSTFIGVIHCKRKSVVASFSEAIHLFAVRKYQQKTNSP